MKPGGSFMSDGKGDNRDLKSYKIYGLLLIGLTLLTTSVIIMCAVLSLAIERTTDSNFIHWTSYIPAPVYVCILIPLILGLYLFFRSSQDN